MTIGATSTASALRWAVINKGAEVLANRNVPNAVKPIVSLIGGYQA